MWRKMQLLWALPSSWWRTIFLTWYQQLPFLAQPCGWRHVQLSSSTAYGNTLQPLPRGCTSLYNNLTPSLAHPSSELWVISCSRHQICAPSPEKASCALLKWRFWHGRGEAEPPPTAHKQHLPFPPTLPTAPVCISSSMDNHRAPLPRCFSHYQETTPHHRLRQEKHQSKAKPTVFQGWNNKPGCSSTEWITSGKFNTFCSVLLEMISRFRFRIQLNNSCRPEDFC